VKPSRASSCTSAPTTSATSCSRSCSCAARLAEASAARIVNVSSGSHYQARGIDFEAVRRPTSSVTGLPEYEVSKLANNLFTKELARGRSGGAARSYALHPGTVATDAWRRIPWPVRSVMKLFMITSDEGAKTTLYCATSPEVEAQDGLYYDRCRAKKPSAESEDAALAKELWERRSEEWVAPFSS
jgi:retinol dehydrogenase-12